MYSPSHFLAAAALGELFVYLGFLSHWHALLAGILAVLIDLDHVVHHALRYGMWSLRGAWNGAITTTDMNYRTWFHWWGGWLLVGALCLGLLAVSKALSFSVLIAYLSHLLLDMYDHLPFSRRHFAHFTIAGFVFNLSLPEALFDGALVLILAAALLLGSGLLW